MDAEAVPQGLTEDGLEMKQGSGFCARYRKTDSGEPGWCSGWCKTNIRTHSLPQCAYHAAFRRRNDREGFRHHAYHANESYGAYHLREKTHAVVHESPRHRA